MSIPPSSAALRVAAASSRLTWPQTWPMPPPPRVRRLTGPKGRMAGIAGAAAAENFAGPPYLAWRVRADLLKRVLTNPGHRMATLMRSGASWTAQPSDRATTANFVALYGSRPAGEIMPAIEAEL